MQRKGYRHIGKCHIWWAYEDYTGGEGSGKPKWPIRLPQFWMRWRTPNECLFSELFIHSRDSIMTISGRLILYVKIKHDLFLQKHLRWAEWKIRFSYNNHSCVTRPSKLKMPDVWHEVSQRLLVSRKPRSHQVAHQPVTLLRSHAPRPWLKILQPGILKHATSCCVTDDKHHWADVGQHNFILIINLVEYLTMRNIRKGTVLSKVSEHQAKKRKKKWSYINILEGDADHTLRALRSETLGLARWQHLLLFQSWGIWGKEHSNFLHVPSPKPPQGQQELPIFLLGLLKWLKNREASVYSFKFRLRMKESI